MNQEGGISLHFAGISPTFDNNFPYEERQVGQFSKVRYVFINGQVHVLEFFSNSILTSSSMTIVKKVIKDSPLSPPFCTAKWNCYNLLGASLKI